MNITQVFAYYMATSVGLAIIFITTAIIMFNKYRHRHIRLHFWAATAFIFLFAQEVISLLWIWQFLAHGVPLTQKPWHLQALCIFLAFNLLGLSMAGRIRD